MFYIDETIISQNEMIHKLEKSVSEKEIDSSFFPTGKGKSAVIDIKQSIYRIELMMDRLKALYTLYEAPITSHRKVLGKYIVFFKKVFRKLTRWLFRPFVDQQNNVNQLVFNLLNETINVEKKLISEIERENK